MVIGPYYLIVPSLDAKMRYPPGGRGENPIPAGYANAEAVTAGWAGRKQILKNAKGRYPMYKAELIKTMVKKTEDHNVQLTDKQTAQRYQRFWSL